MIVAKRKTKKVIIRHSATYTYLQIEGGILNSMVHKLKQTSKLLFDIDSVIFFLCEPQSHTSIRDISVRDISPKLSMEIYL